jgi:hypothetical protein
VTVPFWQRNSSSNTAGAPSFSAGSAVSKFCAACEHDVRTKRGNLDNDVTINKHLYRAIADGVRATSVQLLGDLAAVVRDERAVHDFDVRLSETSKQRVRSSSTSPNLFINTKRKLPHWIIVEVHHQSTEELGWIWRVSFLQQCA